MNIRIPMVCTYIEIAMQSYQGTLEKEKREARVAIVLQ
jgi:hypothetical protein